MSKLVDQEPQVLFLLFPLINILEHSYLTFGLAVSIPVKLAEVRNVPVPIRIQHSALALSWT